MSPMLVFLNSLLTNGRPVLNPGNLKAKVWIQREIETRSSEITELLQDLHQERSLEFPGLHLPFDACGALVGLHALFLLTSATAFRELELAEIQSLLNSTIEPPNTPEAHFSADLCLHHLPDLRQIIARIADGDPLLLVLDQLGLQFPLSSVGLPLEKLPDLSAINSHPGLAQFHAERVLSRSDHHRAHDPSVSKIIPAMAGRHRDQLVPPIFQKSS